MRLLCCEPETATNRTASVKCITYESRALDESMRTRVQRKKRLQRQRSKTMRESLQPFPRWLHLKNKRARRRTCGSKLEKHHGNHQRQEFGSSCHTCASYFDHCAGCHGVVTRQ